MLKYFLFAFLVSLCSPLTNGQWVCPTVEEVYPCECTDSAGWIKCNGASINAENITQVLDRISSLYDKDHLFSGFFLEQTQLTEIPAGIIKSLKFNEILIRNNPNLTYISPNAFNGTKNATTVIKLAWNKFDQNSSSTDWVFDFINEFPNVAMVELQDTGLVSIPDNAFGYLKNLEHISFSNNPLKTVGSYAFSDLPNLNILYLANAKEMTVDSFTPDTFRNLSSSNIFFSLDWVDALEYLPEETFRPALDNARAFRIGGAECGWPISCTWRRFICDSRIDWICDHPNFDLLEGYYCKNTPLFDKIEGYCAWHKSTKN